MKSFLSPRPRALAHTALLLLVATIAGGCKTQPNATNSVVLDDPLLQDNCYAPTKAVNPASKDAWVKGLVDAAKDAEQIYGIPAAGLIAIASRESGFGTTRLYLGAKNAYGFKWTKSSGQGRDYWTLGCQPAADENNKYILFKNDWDAALYVAKRLSTAERYKPTTDRYIAARKAGVDVKKAVDAWIAGIADAGYNYDPATYKKHITQLANNYQTPSWAKDASYNLYWISASVSPRSK